jgi:MarR family transcriptional regulator, organic hydroperoxide resistance regulator
MAKADTSSSNDPLAGDVVELFRELFHALLASSAPAWVDLRLTVPQLRTVFIVLHDKTSSVTRVAQQLGVGEPTASHLVEKLVRAGLVERTEDPADRRRARVRLAPEGEALIEKLLGWEDLLAGWLHKVSPEDLAHFRQGLGAIVDEVHAQASRNEAHGGAAPC